MASFRERCMVLTSFFSAFFLVFDRLQYVSISVAPRGFSLLTHATASIKSTATEKKAQRI